LSAYELKILTADVKFVSVARQRMTIRAG